MNDDNNLIIGNRNNHYSPPNNINQQFIDSGLYNISIIQTFQKNTDYFESLYEKYKSDEKAVQVKNKSFSESVNPVLRKIRNPNILNNIKSLYKEIIPIIENHQTLQNYILNKITMVENILNSDNDVNPDLHLNNHNKNRNNNPKKSIKNFIKDLKLKSTEIQRIKENLFPEQKKFSPILTKILKDIEIFIIKMKSTEINYKKIKDEYIKDLTILNKYWKKTYDIFNITILENLNNYYNNNYIIPIENSLNELNKLSRFDKLRLLSDILNTLKDFKNKFNFYKNNPEISISKKSAFPGYINPNNIYNLKIKNIQSRINFNKDIINTIYQSLTNLEDNANEIKENLLSTVKDQSKNYIKQFKNRLNNLKTNLKQCLNHNYKLNSIYNKNIQLLTLSTKFKSQEGATIFT